MEPSTDAQTIHGKVSTLPCSCGITLYDVNNINCDICGTYLKDLARCDLSKWTTHTQSCNRHIYLFWDPGIRNPVRTAHGIAMLEPKSALARPQSRSSSKKVTLELKDGEASWRNLK